MTSNDISNTTTTGEPVSLSSRSDHSTLALVLALISVPGSIVTWGWLPGGGFVWGLPLAVVAVVLAVPALRTSRGKALAALVVAGLMIAMTVVWTVVGILSS